MFFCCIFSLLLWRLFFLKEYVGDFAVNSIQWVKEKHHHEALCLADLLMLSLFSSDVCNLLKKMLKYFHVSFFHKIFLKCLHASRTQSEVFLGFFHSNQICRKNWTQIFQLNGLDLVTLNIHRHVPDLK